MASGAIAVALAILAGVGCGRYAFDPRSDAAGATDATDAPPDTSAAPAPPSAGLQGWWRADSPSNTCAGAASCADGRAVSSAHDESGHGHEMTQVVVAAQPVFASDCGNGRPCFQFDGMQYFAAVTPLPRVDEWTIFLVMRVADCPGTEPFMAFCPVVIDGTDAEIEGVYVDENSRRAGLDASSAPLLVAYGASSLPSATFSYVAASRGAANAYEVYVNESLDGAGSYPAPKTGDAFDHIARDAESTQGFIFVGAIAEILVYDHVTSAVERASVDAYIHDRYGL